MRVVSLGQASKVERSTSKVHSAIVCRMEAVSLAKVWEAEISELVAVSQSGGHGGELAISRVKTEIRETFSGRGIVKVRAEHHHSDLAKSYETGILNREVTKIAD